MLLDAALRNKGKINYYLKISFLKFVNFIYGNKLYFISITQLETNSIKKFFLILILFLYQTQCQ